MMRLRHTSIRVRVFLLVLIPLLATIGIYAYAVGGELGTAVGLANAGKVSGATISPLSATLQALSAERDAAVLYLVAPSSQDMAALQHEEAVTNKAARVADGVSKSGPVVANASSLEKTAAAKFVRDLGSLGALRGAVASGKISTTDAINDYSGIMDAGIPVAEQAIQETYIGQSLATTARAEVNLFAAGMLAAEEGDIYAADLAQGRMPQADLTEFAQLAGLRRYLVQDSIPQLDAEASGLMRQYVPSSLSAALAGQENAIISARPGAAAPPVSLTLWQKTVRTYATNLVTVMTKSPAWIQSQVVSSARSALTTLIVAASVGFLAVILSILFSLLMGRRLLRRLTALRQAALDLAHDRLPSVMARLRAGETVDVDAESPSAAPSVDEIDQVQQAFTVVHRAAVQAAVDEANLRRGISDVFRNLARRNQALLHRQLGLLDGMERRADEPEQLEDLFRIDHLTTRMRRHAEGLIILSGDSPGRSWSQPVPFIDVLRAAVAEVEDYTRIQVEVRTKAALAGHAVADVVHMLAELLENATVFSPPGTVVRVQGELVGRGFAVEVEDRGLGLTEERLAEINRDLADVPAFDLAGSDRLGLFITGRLAHRHDIKITLRSSPYGGTTAIVIIPMSLVVPDESNTEPLAVAGRPLEPVGQVALGSGQRELGSGRPGNGDGYAGNEDGYPANGHGYPANGHGYLANGTLGNGDGDPANGDGHSGNGHVSDGDGYPGNGHSAVGYADGPPRRGHQGNGSGQGGNGVRSEPWTPRHSAGSSDDSGWFSRPSVDGPQEPESARVEYADNSPNGGLPVRVRQASLAPELRDQDGTDAAAFEVPPVSADAARSTMSALQRGWELGRSETGGAPASSGTAPMPEGEL
jgi:signal transduction histidine kinase